MARRQPSSPACWAQASILSSGIRCAYLTNGAALVGFTLTNGATRGGGTDLIKEQSGAAVWCEAISATVSNCVLTHCYANEYGGGAYSGTLNNCLVSNTTAFISGGGTYLANLNGSVLCSNRLVQGSGGGGAAYGTLSNCLVIWNLAPGYGGGAYYSTLNNCVVSNNTARANGGGVSSGVANNTLISSNWAIVGGGAYSNVLNGCIRSANYGGKVGGGTYQSSLTNCILVNNTASSDSAVAPRAAPWLTTAVSNSVGGPGGGVAAATLRNCIRIDFNTNYFNAVKPKVHRQHRQFLVHDTPAGHRRRQLHQRPGFVNPAAGDFHLQSTSPCINAAQCRRRRSTDLDGNPRISGGTVDLGCYEFQNPASVISYAWLLQYGLPTDGSADFLDSDGDGMSNYAESRTGTNPNDPTSFLHLTSAAPNGVSGVTVTWQSVSGVVYFINALRIWARNRFSRPCKPALSASPAPPATRTRRPPASPASTASACNDFLDDNWQRP